MALRANVWKEGDRLLLQTNYNVVLVRLLNTLPPLDRVFRAETQCYYINLKHEPIVMGFLVKLGYEVTEVDKPVPTGDDSFSVLGLLPTATWEVCEASYRALSKVNHPDVGGNIDTMQQINAAWERIKLVKGKK